MENIVWHKGKITEKDRMIHYGQKGIVIWFTGLSGSGKSTIAVELEKTLSENKKWVYRLDGDNIRHGLNKDLGFSNDDREENIRRISEVAALFQDAGLITLVSFISPKAKMRALAKTCIGKENFIEVYVKASINTCIQRDPKGLYAKALKGEIDNFTGISAPFEEPENPDLIIDTDNDTIQESIVKILNKINEFTKGGI